MKTPTLLVSIALACILASCQSPKTIQAKERPAPEIFEGKVKGIYRAQDGNLVFRSYVVEWRGSDVVVEDVAHYRAGSEKRIGDPIRVLVTRWTDGKDTELEGVLNFICVEPLQKK